MSFPQLTTRRPFQQRTPQAVILTADAGSYDITGTTASLVDVHLMPATTAAFSITGTDAVVKGGFLLTASSAAYDITGVDANFGQQEAAPALSLIDLKRRNYPRAFHPSLAKPLRMSSAFAYSLGSDVGTYTITGTDAALKRGALVGATSGTYAITGTAATLLDAHLLTATAGSYVITGTNATLGTAAAYTLTAASGAYTITGTTATLAHGQFVTATGGTYTITGTAAALKLGRAITATTDAFSISGTPATVTYSGAADQPSLSFTDNLKRDTGVPRAFHPSLRKPMRFSAPTTAILTAASGSVVITGTDATFASTFRTIVQNFRKSHSWPRAFAPGPWGQLKSKNRPPYRDVQTVASTYLLTAVVGAYTVTGTDITLTNAHTLIATGGAFTIAAPDTPLNKGKTITAAAGSIVITGTTAGSTRSYAITTIGGVIITGSDAALNSSAQIPAAVAFSGGLKRKNYPRGFHPALRKPIRVALPQQYVVAATTDVVTITGTAATLRASEPSISIRVKKKSTWPRHFAPSPWGHLVGKSRPPQTFSTAAQPSGIAALAGSFVITGTAASLLYQHVVAASAGAVTITGTAANLNKGQTIAAASRIFTITGTDAFIHPNRFVPATSGAYTISTPATGLNIGRTLVATSGSVAISGIDAFFGFSNRLVAASGAFHITGTAAVLFETIVILPTDIRVEGTVTLQRTVTGTVHVTRTVH